jgi:hypothetical protein
MAFDMWFSSTLVHPFLDLQGGGEDGVSMAVLFNRLRALKAASMDIYWSLSSAAHHG